MCLRLGEEVLLLLHRPSLVLGAAQHRPRRPEDLACHVMECQPSAAAQSPAGVTIDRQRLLRDANLSLPRPDPP
ncbi:unnamed protein product [Gadus morhua 'NCC']